MKKLTKQDFANLFIVLRSTDVIEKDGTTCLAGDSEFIFVGSLEKAKNYCCFDAQPFDGNYGYLYQIFNAAENFDFEKLEAYGELDNLDTITLETFKSWASYFVGGDYEYSVSSPRNDLQSDWLSLEDCSISEADAFEIEREMRVFIENNKQATSEQFISDCKRYDSTLSLIKDEREINLADKYVSDNLSFYSFLHDAANKLLISQINDCFDSVDFEENPEKTVLSAIEYAVSKIDAMLINKFNEIKKV